MIVRRRTRAVRMMSEKLYICTDIARYRVSLPGPQRCSPPFLRQDPADVRSGRHKYNK